MRKQFELSPDEIAEGSVDLAPWLAKRLSGGGAHAAGAGHAGPLRLQLARPRLSTPPRLTLSERAVSYLTAFPQCANAVWVAGEGRWLYGVWQIGGLYKNLSRYYGAYPRTFLERVDALFPEIDPREILHAFSGSLPPGEYTRLDIKPDYAPELLGSVYDIKALAKRRQFRLVIADPPYSAKDALKYGTPPVNPARAFRALASVTKPGGFIVWLDTTWPIHQKHYWHYFGQISLVRSTGHRLRGVSIFERTRAAC